MERLLEDISFAPENEPKVLINKEFVEAKLSKIAQSEDLSRYIL
jgi:ATP-dependent HslUV protease ATP-binding subunit HslU